MHAPRTPYTCQSWENHFEFKLSGYNENDYTNVFISLVGFIDLVLLVNFMYVDIIGKVHAARTPYTCQ